MHEFGTPTASEYEFPCGPHRHVEPALSRPEWYGDRTYPVPRPPVLAPIHEPVPPKHTQIQPRCFTCAHFEMCKFKKDYLKTLTLIQDDLGAPAQNFEKTDKYITIPRFHGFPLENWDKYLPREIEFDNCDHKGIFFAAKFNGINFVNIVYKAKKYFILVQLKYNADEDLYMLDTCKEAFYGVDYELNEESLETMQLGLIDWREVIINAKMIAPLPPPPKKDIINTTHFSAQLDCDMYEWNKDSFEDAVKKMIKKYPHGIPIDENGQALYHIETYHIAHGEVPFAPLFHEKECKHTEHYFPPKPAFAPPKPPKRRGDK